MWTFWIWIIGYVRECSCFLEKSTENAHHVSEKKKKPTDPSSYHPPVHLSVSSSTYLLRMINHMGKNGKIWSIWERKFWASHVLFLKLLYTFSVTPKDTKISWRAPQGLGQRSQRSVYMSYWFANSWKFPSWRWLASAGMLWLISWGQWGGRSVPWASGWAAPLSGWE